MKKRKIKTVRATSLMIASDDTAKWVGLGFVTAFVTVVVCMGFLIRAGNR